MSDWRLWQLADSAFPTGGFAHSGGLEAAYQRGWVRDSDSLEDFLRASATQLEHGVMRFVDEAMSDSGAFAQIDQWCDLFLNNHVANRASRAQGSAMIYSAAKAFESSEIVKLAAEVKSQRFPTHLAPVFGVVAHDLGIAATRAKRLFLFMSIRSILSAAVRLGIVGPIQSQQIQAKFGIDRNERAGSRASVASPPYSGERVGEGPCATSSNRFTDRPTHGPSPCLFPEYKGEGEEAVSPQAHAEFIEGEPVQTSPLLDLVHGTHDRLYSRLFQT